MVHAQSFEMLKAKFPVTEKMAAAVMGRKRTAVIKEAQKKSQMNFRALTNRFIGLSRYIGMMFFNEKIFRLSPQTVFQ